MLELKKFITTVFCFVLMILGLPCFALSTNTTNLQESSANLYQDAINDYAKAIELNPKNPKAYLNRGISKAKMKDYQGAIEDFTKVTKLEPNNSKAFYNRGLVKAYLKDYKYAIEDFTNAIEADKSNYSAYYNRGLCRAYLQDYKGSIKDFTKTIELDPNNSQAYNNRALSRIKLSEETAKSMQLPQQTTADKINSIDKLIKKYDINGYNTLTQQQAQLPTLDSSKNKTPNVKAEEPDFGPYMKDLQKTIKSNWNPPKSNKSERVVLLFKVAKDGRLLALRVFKSSGVPAADKAALNAAKVTAPFKPLPEQFKGNSVDIQFTFDYNVFLNGEKIFKDKINTQEPLINENENKTTTETLTNKLSSNQPPIDNRDEIGEIHIQNYTKAIKNLNRTIKLHPDDYRAYYIRGYCNYIQYNYTRAIADFTKAIELNPNLAMAYSDRGYCKLKFYNYKGAIEDYNKAIELKPNDAKSFCYRGYAEYKLKDYKNSMSDCITAIELNPDFNYSYSVKSLNKIRETKSRTKRLYYHFISFYSQMLDITPNDYDAYYLRGILNLEVKEYNDTIHDFAKYISLSSKNYSTYIAYFDKGYAEYQSKKYQDAIDDFTKVIELKPRDYRAYYDRGLSKSHIKDYQGAIEDITKAIKLNHHCAEAFIARASVKVSLKEYESALNDVIEAKRIYLQKMNIKKYKKIIKILKDIKTIKNPEIMC